MAQHSLHCKPAVQLTISNCYVLMHERNALHTHTHVHIHSNAAAMMRVLKIMDDNGDGKLDRSELKWGLKDYGIVLSATELEAVFSHFDRDRNGFIDRDEFLAGLRGPLSERRRALIAQAFSVLDSTGDGRVTVDDLKGRYSASEHPEVRNGSKTEGQVLAQFLQQWDASADGLVSAAEFEDYYKSVSASIDSDDYFELMMRNGESLKVTLCTSVYNSCMPHTLHSYHGTNTTS
jgi:Ca2+-binding EF-hand superfamily protein